MSRKCKIQNIQIQKMKTAIINNNNNSQQTKQQQKKKNMCKDMISNCIMLVFKNICWFIFATNIIILFIKY